jgi:hypothetical protein
VYLGFRVLLFASVAGFGIWALLARDDQPALRMLDGLIAVVFASLTVRAMRLYRRFGPT